MARQETLTTWILENDQRLDLQVQELSWIKSIFSGWHDLQVSIAVFGERFVGRGSDQNADVALGKAFCEAVERAVCFCHGISSLGVAGHLTQDLAQESAKLEFIERFCFSRQISQKIALAKMNAVDAAVIEKYRTRGVAIGFYRLISPSDTSVVLCLADGESAQSSFGGIFGLGASRDTEYATKKALLECLRSVEFYLYAKPPPLSILEFQKLKEPKTQERQSLLRNRVYFLQLMSSLNQKAPRNFQIPEGKFIALALDSAFWKCPLVFTRYSVEPPLVQPEFLA